MDFNSGMLSFLASVAIRSLGLALLAGMAVLVCRIQSAAARHAVCAAVVAGMLALAVLTPVLAPLPLRILRPEAKGAAGPIEIPILPPSETSPGKPQPSQLTPAAWALPSWQQIGVLVYGAGVLALLIRLAYGYLFMRKLMRAARPIDCRYASEVYESSWISVPMTIGWLHPKILVPLGWDEWPEAKLQAVMAHEKTHVRRGDWAIAIMAGLNRSIFWFHPLAWWLERRLAFLAEQACDDSALLLVGTGPYAEALLDMAAAVKAGQGRLVWEAMAMANGAEVRQRIERILDETRQIPKGLTRSRCAALIACSLPLIYVASVVQLAPAQAQVAQEAQLTAPAQRKGFGPVETPSPMSEQIKGKSQLEPADVARMEQYLTTNPQDLEARKQLILYYFANGVREPRISHIFWLIASHPESTQAAFTSRGITPQTTAMNDASDYSRAAGLWRQQAAAHPTEARVLGNAADFLSQPGGEPGEAERLLIAARTLEASNPGWTNKLARLYTVAIVGNEGDPRFPAFDADLAGRARLQLENSTDGRLLLVTGRMLAGFALRPQPGQKLADGVINLDEHPMLTPAVELGNRLVARSEQFPGGAPANFPIPPSQSAARAVPAQATMAQLEPAPLATAPALITKVEPLYPALARQAKVEGDVHLKLVIGTDGHVRRLEVVSGHPLLVPATIDVVKEWVYAPIPAEGTVFVTVPFRLDGGNAPLEAGQAQQRTNPSRIRMGPAVQAAKLISNVSPVYPEQARAAGISGDVELDVVIGEDGHVQSADPKDGHPLLATAAAEAVRQWVYQPTLLNGQPIEVSTTVTVPFKLQ